MIANGTINKTEEAALPTVPGSGGLDLPTTAQNTAAENVVAQQAAERQRLIVADTTELVTAPGSQTDPGAGRPATDHRLPQPLQAAARLAGLLPFTAYIVLGLFIPLIAVLIGAFQSATTGAWTFSNVNDALHGAYLHGFEQSLELSLIASILPGIFGLLIAYANLHRQARQAAAADGDHRLRRVRQLRRRAAGVLFIASVSSTALITGWLNNIGLNIYNLGFSLFDLTGVAVVYMYFQIPLMVLIILPALEGLRPGVARGGREPRRADLVVLALRRRPGADALVRELPDAAVRLGPVGLRHRRGAHGGHDPADPDSRSAR